MDSSSPEKKSKTIAIALKVHSALICFIIALIISTILSLHAAFAPTLPVADGEGYAARTFSLYGYLHTGQWHQFWHLFVRPRQSLCPLHDLLFFLLPQALASTASYIAAQNIITYLLLAYAVYKICWLLNRAAWAPPILLLVAVNNVALTDFYTFFLDMSFLSCGLWVIALQLQAWRKKRAQLGFFCGMALGLLFWVKPANAIIFLATFTLSEIFYAVSVLRLFRPKKNRRHYLSSLGRHWLWLKLGFIPVALLALFCGGAQTILQLIDQNEIHELAVPLVGNFLLRLFYFPLCLSAFYHVLILGILLAAAVGLSRLTTPAERPQSQPLFPLHLFIPVALAYLILGEFFSFWMLTKPMRSLLLMLPLFGIAFCWLAEKRRVRPELLFFVALIYTVIAFSQKTFNLVGTRDHLAEDNYQLTSTSWIQMPAVWHGRSNLNYLICNLISRDLPPSGTICINSIEIRNSLTWRLQNEDLLLGKIPRYEVANLFNFKGAYYTRSLLGANEAVLITLFSAQSSRRAWIQSMGVLNYVDTTWGTAPGFCAHSGDAFHRSRTLGLRYSLWASLDSSASRPDQRGSAFRPDEANR